MAMSQSIIEKGSDEEIAKSKVIDFCTFCIPRGKYQPATHFCFECGPFGRYICGSCELNHEIFLPDHEVTSIVVTKGQRRIKKQAKEIEQELKKVREENDQLIATIKRIRKDNEQECKRLEDERKVHVENICREYVRQMKGLEKKHDHEMQEKKTQLSEMKKERDDMKTRFSKLAGEKLTDLNEDIADLSDPFRAMKLSEKFGALYDDEWTDAFEILTKKKMPVKDAITFLIQILKECLRYCASISEGQLNGLKNVLLHPSQDVSMHATNPSKPKKGFIQETKSWGDKGYDKKHLEKCEPYIKKCAEICWLMTVHCPPLYIKLDVQHGDKLDPNYFWYNRFQSKEIDYLVWPPLFNEQNGGLLKKGVAEGIQMGSEK